MYVDKDKETARLSFHMAKLFSNFAAMHEELLMRKMEIADAIMMCLRDRDIPPLEKKEALQMVPFLIGSRAAIDMF